MKVTVLLRNDHEELKNLFARFRKAGARSAEAKKERFEEIRRAILIHWQMEREIFYPAVAAAPSRRAAELTSKAEREHRSIEKLLQEMKGLDVMHKDFDAAMSRLEDEVAAHMELEEQELFEEARRNMPEQRLEELGLELEDRRKILVTIAA